jgi:hypothetical protein
MKKLFIVALLIVAALNVNAQGTIDFANSPGTLITTNTGGAILSTASGGTFHVALYWGALGSTEEQLVQIGAIADIGPAGQFSGGTRITGTTPGSFAVFQVRAWSGIFSTYEQAILSGNSSEYAGVSALWINGTGGSGSPPEAPAPFDGFQGFSVAPIPEPSVYAMAFSGAAALFVCCRRKRV